MGGAERVVDAHNSAVTRALGWFERNAAETRMKYPETGRMARAGGQKTVIFTFRHETSRNLDPALHTHSVIANMLLGVDAKWRTMANERLYASKMLLGALYRSELAGDLMRLGYRVEKTHADGRFEIGGVSRETIEAFSSRRAEIEAAMEGRGHGATAENQHLARRMALMTREHKREVDREALRGIWEKQASELGLESKALVASAAERALHGLKKEGAREAGGDISPGTDPAKEAVEWALAHLSERDAVFARTDILAAALAQGRLTKGAARKMHAAFAKTVLVVDEGSLASTVQARDLLRIAGTLRIPKLVLVGDATFARFPLTRSGTSTTVIPDCPGLVSSGNARMSDR